MLLVVAWAALVFAGCRDDDAPAPSPLGVAGGIAGAAGRGIVEEPPAVCEPESRVAHTSGPGVGQLPAPTEGAPTADGAPMQFAVRRMFVGDTDFYGSPGALAWKEIGRDLDGFTSDKSFDCHCKSVSRQAKPDIRTDGTNGIDNAFGNIIIAQGTVPIEDASQATTGSIEEGGPSLVLSFADLGDGPSYGSVRATVSPVQMPTGQVPRFDATDSWRPFAGAPFGAVVLDGGWVTDHTWVSPATDQTLVVTVASFGLPMRLPIQQVRITAKLSPDRSRIERGIISGVMSTEAYIADFSRNAGRLNLCGSAFDSVAEQIRQASDSPLNGVHDPAIVCDGMSVGIGFTALRTGTIGDPIAVAPEPDPCVRP